MARSNTNNLLKGLSGKVGNVIFKHYAYGTVISKMPDRSKVKLTKKQKAANTRFQEAVSYAKSVIANPAKSKRYKKQSAKTGRSVYHLALADFLKKS